MPKALNRSQLHPNTQHRARAALARHDELYAAKRVLVLTSTSAVPLAQGAGK